MKMRSTWAVLAAVSALSTLSGCANMDLKAAEEARALAARQTETDRIVSQDIQQSSATIRTKLNYIETLERRAQETIAAEQRAKEAERVALEAEKAARLQPASIAMLDTQLRIVWKNDSAEDLLKQLSGQLGLGFEVKGVRRSLPNVTVVGEPVTVRKILETVSAQIDRSADVVLVKGRSASEKSRLELRFK